MMEFLDKIYGYEHFGIILFAFISVLVVIFLIVLFFGKKDEKKRELERTQALEAQKATEGFAEVNPEPTTLDIASPVLENEESIIPPLMEQEEVVMNTDIEPVEPVMTETPVVEEMVTPVLEPTVAPELITNTVSPVLQPEINLEPINIPAPETFIDPVVEEPIPEIKIPDFNFDELAASIASELSALEKQTEENKVVEPVTPITPVVEATPIEVPITPISEIAKPTPTPGPVTFSSVYINKPVEPVKEEMVVEPVVETPVVEPTPIVKEIPRQPINPGIVLPEGSEMPTLNKPANAVVENEAKVVPDFSQFEGESYNLR